MTPMIPMQIRWTTTPGNAQVICPFDSTYRLDQCVSHASFVAGTTSFDTPGDTRGKWAGWTVRGSASSTGGNDSTLSLYVKTANTNTFTDWQIDAAGGATVNLPLAGTTTPFRWRPTAGEFKVRILAGATGPTTFFMELTLMPPGFDLVA